MSEGERYGVVGSESGEIFFTESALTSGMPIGRIKVQIKRQGLPPPAQPSSAGSNRSSTALRLVHRGRQTPSYTPTVARDPPRPHAQDYNQLLLDRVKAATSAVATAITRHPCSA
jgi:hypothetical protein